MNRSTLIGSLLCLTLSACSTVAEETFDAKRQQIQQTVPTCKTDKECEIKWSAAREWVLDNAGFKIQIMQPDYIETYNATQSSSSLAVRVQKKPIPAGGYRIEATVWCDSWISCHPDKWDALLDFNNKVNAAWQP